MAFPTGGVLDAFTRADQTPPGGSWSGKIFSTDGDCSIISNQLGVVSPTTSYSSVWPTPHSDVERYAYTGNTDADDYLEIWCRLTNEGTTTPNGYCAQVFTASGQDMFKLFRVDAGVYAQIGSTDSTHELGGGDWWGIEAIGSAIKLYFGGPTPTWVTAISTTDSTYPSGKSGVRYITPHAFGPNWLDSWSGMDVDPTIFQKIRPDSDIVTTGWSTAPLWSKVDEDTPGGDTITGVAS